MIQLAVAVVWAAATAVWITPGPRGVTTCLRFPLFARASPPALKADISTYPSTRGIPDRSVTFPEGIPSPSRRNGMLVGGCELVDNVVGETCDGVKGPSDIAELPGPGELDIDGCGFAGVDPISFGRMLVVPL